MRTNLWTGLALAICSGTAAAQAPAPAPAQPRFAEQFGSLINQASSGFKELRGDSIGAGVWRGRFLLAGDLDTTVVYSSTTISVLARQHADGRPGNAIVGVFPVALVAAGTDSTVFTTYQALIAASLTSWQKRGPGNWSECADPRRGREVLLFPTRTASGEALLSVSVTLHPDPTCA